MKRLSVENSRRRSTRKKTEIKKKCFDNSYQKHTVILPVERDEGASLFIEVSPEIGKEVLQLRQTLHIAVFKGIADYRNLNDVRVEVNAVILFNVFSEES